MKHDVANTKACTYYVLRLCNNCKTFHIYNMYVKNGLTEKPYIQTNNNL